VDDEDPASRGSFSPECRWIGTVLYVAGGLDASGQPTTTLFAYDTRTDTWTTKASMPTAGACGASGVIDDRLYVFTTDCRESALGADPAFQRYDPASDTWTTRAKAPNVRYQDAGAVLNGLLYVIGGGTGTDFLAALDVYNPRTDTWRTLNDMPTARGFLTPHQ